MKGLSYKSVDEKTALVQQETAKGLVLVEERNHVDGDFLVFGPPPPPTLEQAVAALEARVAALEAQVQMKKI